ncbi:MAG TPA: Asp-tRNA(Asn)/Glu-tRNA(Gln) amidotransferase subunit GatC [Candidatus Polarisedimenticolaceae bacterium]|nr:Asp-tRNA(Asn)/Glu-tRNA(Gln) amidotransferase subunit GatC [Candidatus Polarisedimenticolaceae bacterium]
MRDGTLDDATLRHLASLAQLTLDEATLPDLRAQLGTILAYVTKLQEVEVAGAGTMAHAGSAAAGLRPDEVRPSLPVEDALAPAPEAFAGLFRVPRVLSG